MKFITYKGKRIAYSREGKGQPIFFLHGVGASPKTYLHIFKKLKGEYTIVTPEMPGHGASDAPDKNWTFSDYAEIMKQIIKNEKLQNIILIGHSFGGGLALCIASDKSVSIQKLILLSPAAIPLTTNFWKQAYYFTIKKTLYEFFETKESGTFFLTMGKGFLGTIIKRPRDAVLTIQNLSQVLWDKSRTELYKNITVPITIFWGETDVVFPKSHSDEILKHIPHAKITYIDGSHSWAIFQPTKFAKLLQEAIG